MDSSRIRAALVCAAVFVGSAGLAPAQTTTRASVDATGVQGNHASNWPALSSNGRFVAFTSSADNLVAGDTNGKSDIFERDLLLGTIERVSVSSSGAQADFASNFPQISSDGRFVVFVSDADNLVAGDANSASDIFVHDRTTGATERVSVDSLGGEGDASSTAPALSADGRFVAFCSSADDLVAGDTNGVIDVFVHDRSAGTTERVSLDDSGQPGDRDCFEPSISADGQRVVFISDSSQLVAGDTNDTNDVFLRDRVAATTTRVNVSSAGLEGDAGGESPVISADGGFVEFESVSDNLCAGDTNFAFDIFVRDLTAGTTERVSVDSSGNEANGSSMLPSFSADGRFASFASVATNLVSGDTNGQMDVFVHDRAKGTTVRANVSSAGTQSDARSYFPSISGDGRAVAFESTGTNLVSGDTNGVSDVFVRAPFLTLDASPASPGAGATLSLATWTGTPSGAVLIAAVDVAGSFVFLPVLLGQFDAAGRASVAGVVPGGLAGFEITFQSFAIAANGKVAASNRALVDFQ